MLWESSGLTLNLSLSLGSTFEQRKIINISSNMTASVGPFIISLFQSILFKCYCGLWWRIKETHVWAWHRNETLCRQFTGRMEHRDWFQSWEQPQTAYTHEHKAYSMRMECVGFSGSENDFLKYYPSMSLGLWSLHIEYWDGRLSTLTHQ